jgi:uncharacterized protein (TIGR02231 family)
VKNSGFAGRTSIKYVAPGERFELGWGPDPSLRVARQHEHLDEESKVLSSWVTTPHRVSVHLSNIGPEPRLMEVLERIPVSEVEKVKITLDPKHTSPGASEPDADGFVRWTVDLTAFARRSVRIAYAVKKHPDVVGI